MSTPLRSCFVLLTALLALVPIGCDSAEEEGPEGTYTATRFVLTPDGGDPVDLLADGASLSITLENSDVFTGSIFVPAVYNEPDEGDLDLDFSGTYTIVNDAVTFTSDADLFVQDATWTLDGDGLSTTYNSGGATIYVVLER